ncbi:MAG: hypothetical protein LLF94_06665 [Chlamydiales bacterium]|nr:hypothetical protein [Chlamydiales bacterium]
MTVAAISNAIPQSVKDTYNNVYNTASKYVKDAHKTFKTYENRAVTFLKSELPKSLHPAAEKIARAVPETLATMSMLTSISPLRFLAGAFLAAKAIYTIAPVAKSAVNATFEGEEWEAAKTVTKARANAVIDKFAPAVCTAFAVTGVAIGVLGLVTLRPSLLSTASLFGIISAVGYKAMTPPPAEIIIRDAQPAAATTNVAK